VDLNSFLALPTEEKAKVYREIEDGKMKPSEYPGKIEYRHYRRSKKAQATMSRLKAGICPFCGTMGATSIKPRQLGTSIGQRDIQATVKDGRYWQCDNCTGSALAKVYTGGSKHLKAISQRKQMADGSVGYFDGSKRIG
jgi:hypothetical protein